MGIRAVSLSFAAALFIQTYDVRRHYSREPVTLEFCLIPKFTRFISSLNCLSSLCTETRSSDTRNTCSSPKDQAHRHLTSSRPRSGRLRFTARPSSAPSQSTFIHSQLEIWGDRCHAFLFSPFVTSV